MNKFGKRIIKFLGNVENCLVIGHGYGKIEDICKTFKTVFISNDVRPEFKAKNLIFRENLENLGGLGEISVIFVDRNVVEKLKFTVPLLYQQNPYIIIEGGTTIDRELSKDLYEHSYRSIAELEIHHVWKSQR